MKLLRLLFLSCALLCIHVGLQAQGRIRMSGYRGDVFGITMALKDSLSGEAVQFASVYLKPAKDTIITNFTLSDQKGGVILDNVTRGDYRLYIEMLGYKPVQKRVYVSEWLRIGTVLLQEDSRMLEAAKVSAAVNPMEIKGDTLVYNAAAFQVGQNDVLKDLLKQMPGIEVDDDGGITVQGETVSRITVNGRTFFMGDKRAALDNLPAHAVDKVKVTDRDSDVSKATGMRRADSTTKSMDVALKQEYSKGTFGNIRASGGASLPSEGQDEMVADIPFLWNASGMLSSFADKDQTTLIARGQNVDSGDRTRAKSASGITKGGQAGINLNTSRMKNLNTDLSVYWNGTSRENATRSTTEDYPASGDEVLSERNSNSTRNADNVSASLRLSGRRTADKMFTFNSTVSYASTSSAGNSSSASQTNGTKSNTSTSTSSASSKGISANGRMNFYYMRLKKKGRSLGVEASYNLGNTDGDSREHSLTQFVLSGIRSERDLRYDNTSGNASGSIAFNYVEPITEKLLLQTNLLSNISHSRQDKNAFNADGSANDFYSVASRNDSRQERGELKLQYTIGNWALQAGASANLDNLHTFSKSQGVSSDLGKGEWLWNWAPELNLIGKQLNVSYTGRSSQPSHDRMLSVLDITDPLRISTGNIYLRPSFSHNLTVSAGGGPAIGGRGEGRKMAEKRFFANFTFRTGLTSNQTVIASWYDADRVRYSIPVNARKPAISSSANLVSTYMPDPKKYWRLTLEMSGSFSRTVNYQATGMLPGMDTGSFDYADFMSSFWGGKSGNRFYSGQSGFAESLTRHLMYTPSLKVQYRNSGGFMVMLGNAVTGNHAWYSLDNSSDSDTYAYNASVEMSYTTPHKFKMAGYYFFSRYFGYSDSFSNTTNNLNFSVTKDIRSLTLSLQAKDVFNSGLTVSHRISETGVTDSYTLSMGRHFLIGAAWHLGRMGAKQSRNASRSTEQIMNTFR